MGGKVRWEVILEGRKGRVELCLLVVVLRYAGGWLCGMREGVSLLFLAGGGGGEGG